MQKYKVLKPFALPDGTTAKTGSTVTMTERQARYLLLSGKLTQDDGEQRIKEKTPAKKEK